MCGQSVKHTGASTNIDRRVGGVKNPCTCGYGSPSATGICGQSGRLAVAQVSRKRLQVAILLHCRSSNCFTKSSCILSPIVAGVDKQNAHLTGYFPLGGSLSLEIAIARSLVNALTGIWLRGVVGVTTALSVNPSFTRRGRGEWPVVGYGPARKAHC
jgi:hypothetical protein